MSLRHIIDLLELSEDSFLTDEETLQLKLAPILRKKAMQHLADAKTTVAKGFRGEYGAAHSTSSYQDYLSKQSKDQAWGTDIDAAAVGEFFGFHVVVTPVKKGVTQDTFCLYRASCDNAPVIHLYNSDNSHWFFDPQKPTLANNNCLFNAIAQSLKSIVKTQLKPIKQVQPEKIQAASPIETPNLAIPKKTQHSSQKNSLFTRPLNSNEHGTIEIQKKIQNAISKKSDSQSLKKEFEAEKIRIQDLSPKEQKQIQDDHEFALRLASQEALEFNQQRKMGR